MAFDAGSIVAKITLDKTDFDKGVKTIRNNVAELGQSMVKMGQDIRMVGRQISQVGTALSFIGAGIITPLVVAFKSAEKYSNSVRQEMERLTNVGIQLRVSIAEALTPVMHKLSNILGDLLNRWQALSPVVRENIVRIVFMTGAYTLLGGIFLSLTGKIIALVGVIWKLVGAFAALVAVNLPLALTYLAIIGIVTAMWKWKEVADVVLNVFEALAYSLGAILSWIKASLWGLLSIFYEVFGTITEWISRLPIPFKGTLGEMAKNWKEMGDKFQLYADRNMTNVGLSFKRVGKIIKGEQNDWANGFNNLKNNISEFQGLFDKLGGKEVSIPNKIFEAHKSFAEGWRDSLDSVIDDLGDWGKTAGNIVQQVSNQMQSSLSNFFQGFLRGEIRSAKQLFVEWGNFVLKIISDVIAQFLTAQIITGLKSIFGIGGIGGGGGAGTAVSAFAGVRLPGVGGGFQEGTEKVPYTGLYKLHEGEKVTPKYDVGKSENIPLTIYNLITPEAIASAMAGKEGENVIVNVINVNSLRNGIVRREVKRR